ncbi:unnamed protein product [Acanthosepion pharaonis]|uniref:Uncharacterized protein n=1 Tax=Acanthosepion pharaonis TaxID=158019 RepID=A0A812BGG8_ACAPH|nr:unnamed protein product [Sepia pharaonis]
MFFLFIPLFINVHSVHLSRDSLRNDIFSQTSVSCFFLFSFFTFLSRNVSIISFSTLLHSFLFYFLIRFLSLQTYVITFIDSQLQPFLNFNFPYLIHAVCYLFFFFSLCSHFSLTHSLTDILLTLSFLCFYFWFCLLVFPFFYNSLSLSLSLAASPSVPFPCFLPTYYFLKHSLSGISFLLPITVSSLTLFLFFSFEFPYISSLSLSHRHSHTLCHLFLLFLSLFLKPLFRSHTLFLTLSDYHRCLFFLIPFYGSFYLRHFASFVLSHSHPLTLSYTFCIYIFPLFSHPYFFLHLYFSLIKI